MSYIPVQKEKNEKRKCMLLVVVTYCWISVNFVPNKHRWKHTKVQLQNSKSKHSSFSFKFQAPYLSMEFGTDKEDSPNLNLQWHILGWMFSPDDHIRLMFFDFTECALAHYVFVVFSKRWPDCIFYDSMLLRGYWSMLLPSALGLSFVEEYVPWTTVHNVC
jgi:hypothetical protein